jgi:hypothetical protein
MDVENRQLSAVGFDKRFFQVFDGEHFPVRAVATRRKVNRR